MIGTLVPILQCSLASSHRAERGDIMQDFSVCVRVSFSLFLSFLISILYVNVKKTCLWHFSGQGMYYNIWSFVFILDFKGLTS